MRAKLAVLAALVAASPAWASHGTHYQLNPVEHDDQGRSDEPDFARTSVLGPPLENRVLDYDLDGAAAPDSALPPPRPGRPPVLAPGCTDDDGRQPSGRCGITTLFCGGGWSGNQPSPLSAACVLGVRGMGFADRPGGYAPDLGRGVRLLDVRSDAMAAPPGTGWNRVDLHHKAADALGERAPPPVLAGPMAHWAWLGTWQDWNNNGVIDHLQDSDGGTPWANEFVWHGACVGAEEPPRRAPRCAPDPAPSLVLWAFPGDHTGGCGLAAAGATALCPTVSRDAPGAEALCAADAALLGGALALAGRCGASCEEGLCAEGDPLLGPQGSVAPDGRFGDNSGHPDATQRGWLYRGGWNTHYYDPSLVVGHMLVAAYRAPPDPGHPNRYRPAEAPFLDVDVHRALSPALDELVQGQAKPGLRGAWLLARGVAGW